VRDIRTLRVHSDLALRGIHDKVHIFHGDRAKQHFISQDQGSDVTEALTERDLDWTYVWHTFLPTIRNRYFPDGFLIKLKLQRDMFWNTQHQRAGVSKGLNSYRRQFWLPRIAELELSEYVTHDGTPMLRSLSALINETRLILVKWENLGSSRLTS